MVELSPPGMISPSSPARAAARRTSTASTPSRRRTAAWSAKLPWSASTPMRGGAGDGADPGPGLAVVASGIAPMVTSVAQDRPP